MSPHTAQDNLTLTHSQRRTIPPPSVPRSLSQDPATASSPHGAFSSTPGPRRVQSAHAMSFFGFNTALPRDRGHGNTAPGFAQPHDAFAGLSGREAADTDAA